MKANLLVSLCLGVFVVGAAWADVPKTINYQGRLTDLTGVPVPDGGYSLTIRMYDAVSASEGASVWSDVYSVQTKNGYFNVVLGSSPSFPLNMAFDRQYWIGVHVSGDASEMTPRQPLCSAPYALSVAKGAVTNAWTDENQTITISDLETEHTVVSIPISLEATANILVTAKSVVGGSTGVRRVFYRIYLDSTLEDHTDIGHTGFLESFITGSMAMIKDVPAGAHTVYLKVLLGTSTVTPVVVADSRLVVVANYK